METVSSEDFKKKYGEKGMMKFALSDFDKKQKEGADPNSLTQDLKTGFQGAVSAFDSGMERTIEAGQRESLLGRTAGRLGAGFRFAGDALGSIGSGVLRALPGGTTVSNAVEGAIGAGFNAVKESPVGEGAKEVFEVLPEGAQTWIKDVGNIALGSVGIAGALTAPGFTSTVTKGVVGKIDDVVRSTAKNARPAIRMNVFRVGELLNKYRVQLSDIDPRYETVLKQQPTPEKVMSYFDQAEKSAVDPSVPMATKLASDRAVDAYKAIDAGASEAGKLKSELLDSIADQKIPGNIAGKSIDTVKKTIGDRFGIVIDKNGNISQKQGRMASVDNKSQALISQYVGMLRELGQAPTARQLDDFVDASQRMLYKQSSPNLFDVADQPVIAFLKQQTGEINSQLKQNVDSVLKATGKDPSYASLNEKYSKLLELNESLNKRLGTEGDKGASMMKALYSPQTGEPTRRLFQQIKDETGIDLFEEATLAKFAMESVGDPRSKSLLQQLDVLAGDVSAVDLTKPGSWLNYIREKVDLDGRDLAEQIIQQNQRLRSASAMPNNIKYTNQSGGNATASPIAPTSMSNTPIMPATVPQPQPKATDLSTATPAPVQKTSLLNDTTKTTTQKVKEFMFPPGLETDRGFISAKKASAFPKSETVASKMDGADFVTLEYYLDALENGTVPMKLSNRAETLLDAMKVDTTKATRKELMDWIADVLVKKEDSMKKVKVQ